MIVHQTKLFNKDKHIGLNSNQRPKSPPIKAPKVATRPRPQALLLGTATFQSRIYAQEPACLQMCWHGNLLGRQQRMI